MSAPFPPLFALGPFFLFPSGDARGSLHALGRPEWPSPAGNSPNGLLSFRRKPPFLVSTACPPLRPAIFPREDHRRRPSFSLSSRKKFFYNFRIALFHPSLFFYFQEVSLESVYPPIIHPPARSSPTYVVFLLSHFRLVLSVCYFAFRFVSLLVSVVPRCVSVFFLPSFLFWKIPS